MPTTFLIAATIGLLLALNARRAVRLNVLLVPAFFASWLVAELAPQLLVLHLAGVAWFVVQGALEGWQGVLGGVIAVASAALLADLVRDARRSETAFDEALTAAIGPAAAHRKLAWSEFAFPFKLWSRKIRRVRNVPYMEPGTRRFQLDVWHTRTDATDGPRPCLLYVPGGGWLVAVSNKNQQGKPLLIEMASRGWVCFAMNYPVAPRRTFPAHIIAVKHAIAWIRANAHSYGGDPRFLMVTGNSAGGHLSSLAALTPNDADFQPGFEDVDTAVQAVAPMYGVYDFTDASAADLTGQQRRHKLGSLRFLQRVIVRQPAGSDIYAKGSPWHRVGEHAPPFLLIHGANDSLALASEARAFAARLREVSKEPVIHVELPRTQHAFDHFLSIRALHAVRAIARFAEWAYERWTNQNATSGADPSPPRDRAAPSPTSQN